MDKIVEDSSVVIKWFVVEPLSNQAYGILDSYRTGALGLHAPDLIFAEIGNIIWKKCRFQGLAITDAQQILDAFQRLTFVVTPNSNLLEEAYRLAIAYNRSVYDTLYIALSVREQCPYVTADERLVNAIRPSLPNVLWVSDWK